MFLLLLVEFSPSPTLSLSCLPPVFLLKTPHPKVCVLPSLPLRHVRARLQMTTLPVLQEKAKGFAGAGLSTEEGALNVTKTFEAERAVHRMRNAGHPPDH